MLSLEIENTQVEETPSQILAALLKTADVVLAKARARTLRPYGHGRDLAYAPAPAEPSDLRMCA